MAMVAPNVSEPSPPDVRQPVPGEPDFGRESGQSDSSLESPHLQRKEQLLSVQYNQDATCFACGTSSGFRIYSCDPMRETIRRDFNEGGIGMVSMLFRCNFLSLVGGGDNPRYPTNKVMIWDDNQNRCIGELSFRSEVRSVLMRRDRIVVVLEYKIYVYNFADLKVLHQIETWRNVKGICGVSQATNNTVLACPGTNKTQVRVELFDLKKTYFIRAHENELACLALSLDGRRLATASSRGTLIRIFNTADGSQLQELRRGADKADILSIAFAPKTPQLAVTSDKGTVHVFGLTTSSTEEDNAAVAAAAAGTSLPLSPSASAAANMASSLSFMKGVLPKYFSSEWSLAQFRIPEDVKSYAAFGAEVSVLNVVCANGRFYKLRFDPKSGGDMKQEQVISFLSSDAQV